MEYFDAFALGDMGSRCKRVKILTIFTLDKLKKQVIFVLVTWSMTKVLSFKSTD